MPDRNVHRGIPKCQGPLTGEGDDRSHRPGESDGKHPGAHVKDPAPGTNLRGGGMTLACVPCPCGRCGQCPCDCIGEHWHPCPARPLACVPCGCGSTAWSIPGAPRALPGHTLDASKVLAVCLDCGATNTVTNTLSTEAAA